MEMVDKNNIDEEVGPPSLVGANSPITRAVTLNLDVLQTILSRHHDRFILVKAFNGLRRARDGRSRDAWLTLAGMGFAKCEIIVLRHAFKSLVTFKTLEKSLVNEIESYLEEALNEGGSEDNTGDSPPGGSQHLSRASSATQMDAQQLVPPSVGSIISESIISGSEDNGGMRQQIPVNIQRNAKENRTCGEGGNSGETKKEGLGLWLKIMSCCQGGRRIGEEEQISEDDNVI